jgi:hypothetical protein
VYSACLSLSSTVIVEQILSLPDLKNLCIVSGFGRDSDKRTALTKLSASKEFDFPLELDPTIMVRSLKLNSTSPKLLKFLIFADVSFMGINKI